MSCEIVNVNGELFKDVNEAKVSVFDRGFLYGDSIYEVCYINQGRAKFLEEHLNRLINSANLIKLDLQFSKKEIIQEIKKTYEAIGCPRVYTRLIITRGEGPINLTPEIKSKQNFVILMKESQSLPEEYYLDGVKIIVADTRRTSKESVDPSVKSGNYLNNVMALMEAQSEKAHEAVMLNSDGLVTEATTSNIWIVKDNALITPPSSAGLLAGITRQNLLEICREQSIEVKEKNLSPLDLLDADEVFLTSSNRRVLPVTTIGNHKVSDGQVGNMSKRLLGLYLKRLEQKSLSLDELLKKHQ